MTEHLRSRQSLPTVRRFEAAGFRAWPASTVHYDGAWLLRLSAANEAKRLNSVNLLDPGDCADLGPRIEKARRRFEAFGRPLTFRLSPLAGAPIQGHLDAEGWTSFSESLVMRLAIDEADLSGVIQQIPLRDIGRFVDAAVAVRGLGDEARPGLNEIVASIQPETGLFALKSGEEPLATAICVRDGDLAGLFEIATAARWRGRGHGRRIVLAAINWARLKGARTAWLQVEADNAAAVALYGALGFEEVYRYRYRRPSGA